MRNEEHETFSALGVSADLVEVLNRDGLITAFPVQRLCIPDALAGRDVCGKAKTGSGKTLAFGLPLVERVARASPKRPTGLVLVPTRELALQVADVLRPLAAARDLRLVAVYGGARMSRQIDGLAKGAEIVVATPGRLIDLIDRKVVDLADIGFVVIDEADRMADMGFLPQVEWVLRHVGHGHQTLLFSATLDGGIQGLVDRYQHDPVFHEVGSPSQTVERMVHRFLLVHEMDRPRVAAAIIRSVSRCLVFTNTKRAADKVARQLTAEGVDARAIHGDLRQDVRERALKRFSEGKLRALVATDVAARGLDIDEIDVVIQYEAPPEPKTYLHRAGRTARAGATGLAVTLLLWNEELLVRRVKRRLGLDEPIVEMFSNDERLADLAEWDPTDQGVGLAGTDGQPGLTGTD
ncbi:MAG: DEAD/DEAH box helicase [Acidimicrobiia bacterium]